MTPLQTGYGPPGLKERLEEIEGRLAELDAALATPAPSPVRVHQHRANLPHEGDGITAALEDPDIGRGNRGDP